MRYVIRAQIEGENAWFMGLVPSPLNSEPDASWSTARYMATEFNVKRAAEDTALALKVGTVEAA